MYTKHNHEMLIWNLFAELRIKFSCLQPNLSVTFHRCIFIILIIYTKHVKVLVLENKIENFINHQRNFPFVPSEKIYERISNWSHFVLWLFFIPYMWNVELSKFCYNQIIFRFCHITKFHYRGHFNLVFSFGNIFSELLKQCSLILEIFGH